MTDLVSNLAADLLRLGLANALATTLLAALVGVLTFPVRRKRPALVHALWLLVLLKLVTPPLWTLPVSWPAATIPTTTTTQAAVKFVTLTEEQLRELLAAQEEAAITPAPQPAPPPAPPTDWPRIAMATVALAWIGGSSLCLTLIVVRSWRFARLLRHATPAPPGARRQAERIAARLGVRRCPGVWFVPGAVCPMLWAVAGDARLLLPRGLWDRLDAAQRDTLLAHELAHLLRRDHWVRLLEVAATVLYWWHPVLWWARRGLREAEEQCCDAWVVWSMPAAVRHYMSAILEAVDYVSDPNPTGAAIVARPVVPALASGMGEFRRLERRLWMIRQNESPRRLGRPALLGVVLAAAAALPLAPTMARQDDVVEESQEAQTTSETQQEETRTVIVRPIQPGGDAPVATTDAAVGVDVSPLRVISVDGRALTVTSEVRTTETAGDGGAAADLLARVKEPHPVLDYAVSSRYDKEGAKSREAQIRQARYEVEAAAANLAVAKQRLAQLERGDKVVHGLTLTVPKKDAPGHQIVDKQPTTDSRVTLRMKPADKIDKASRPNGDDGNRGDRLDQLEQKLEKIDRLLGKLLDEKGDKQGDKYKEKEQPASYDPGPRVF